MIRVRFAPSPTGFLHIGGLRTALYNFLFARKNKGKFILRIEDTDRKRLVKGALESLIKTLKVVGLKYDEGPFLRHHSVKLKVKSEKLKSKEEFIIEEKGKYGPYIQSERIGIYRNLAQKLVDKDKAYYCFCTPKELEEMRNRQLAQKLPPHYDGRCRRLTKEQIAEKLKNNTPYVIRLKVPHSANSGQAGEGFRRSVKFKDLIRGKVEFNLKDIDDQILLKSDGWPTYHLANVVDDHLMKITHVIRGEEWLPSTPKHILIYQALDWPVPQFAHLPLLLNSDRSKLSKRQGDVAVEDFLANGYLPEALFNFIALLGWNPGGEKEIFTLKELIKEFRLEKVQKAGAVFNHEKLDWINGYYIRKMRVSELTKKCVPYLIQAGLIKPPISDFQFLISKQIQRTKYKIQNTGEIVNFEWLKKVVALEQERMKKLSDIVKMAEFFFVNKLKYDPMLLIWPPIRKSLQLKEMKTKAEEVVKNLNLVKENLNKFSVQNFKSQKIEKSLMKLAQERGTGQIFWPLRVALSGQKGSPPPTDIAEILGKGRALTRIDEGIEKISNF